MSNWKNTELYREWYQGCKGKVNEDLLNNLEDGREFVAEPKRDGIWIAAFGGSDGTRFFSRTVDEKKYSLNDCKDLKGLLLVGELGYGSQESKRRRASLGHDFMDVYDLIGVDYDTSFRKLSGTERRRELVKIFKKLPAKVRRHFRLTPRWRTMFLSRYMQEHEGLILKHLESDKGYVGGGTKVSWWMKAKKDHDVDMVIMDWEESTAETKQEESFVKHLHCGMYVNGKLKMLTKVGAMSHDRSKDIAANFDKKYKGRVITIKHFGQFKSGGLRHPSLVEPCPREDKRPKECIFDPSEN